MSHWLFFAVFAVFAVQGVTPSALAAPYTPSQSDPVGERWRWRTFLELRGESVRSLVEGKDGSLWFGMDHEVRRYGVAWTSFTKADSLPGGLTLRPGVDQDSSLWAIAKEGISRFDGERWTPISGVPERPYFSILQARDGTVYVGGEGQLLTLRGRKWMAHTLSYVPISGRILDLTEGRDGAIYLAVPGEGAFRFDPTETRYRAYEGLRVGWGMGGSGFWPRMGLWRGRTAQDGPATR